MSARDGHWIESTAGVGLGWYEGRTREESIAAMLADAGHEGEPDSGLHTIAVEIDQEEDGRWIGVAESVGLGSAVTYGESEQDAAEKAVRLLLSDEVVRPTRSRALYCQTASRGGRRYTTPSSPRTGQDAAANAALIAAAPDLLAAAEDVALCLYDRECSADCCDLCGWDTTGEHDADCPVSKLQTAIANAREDFEERLSDLDASERETMISRDEPHDLMHEVADSHVPVYTYDLMQLAAVDAGLATDEPEVGAAFDGSPTPVNIIAANVFERIAADLWERWTEYKAEQEEAATRAIEEAEALGREAGRNAAAWWEQDAIGGRASGDVRETARLTLDGIEAGDPAVLDSFPPVPNLSGEWAGEPTPADILTACGIDALHDAADDVLQAWEDAASTAMQDAIADACRSILAAAE